MNKDLDARILPQGEYRNALNVQISRSESDTVGSLENVLGNSLVIDFKPGSKTIGYFADDASSMIYVFVTDYLDDNNPGPTYDISKNHGIYSYNTLNNQSTLLVSGAFLNFSQSNPIYGVNLLEELLFWTDNRNQPRKINIKTASEVPNYYTTEEQISVAKNFPYQPMQLWQESQLGTSASEIEYETTMYDVSSKFYPSGGEALTNGVVSSSATFPIDNIIGSISVGSIVTGIGVTAGTTVVAYNEPNLQVNQAQTFNTDNVELVFNANPYYESTFNGDPSYLEDRFVRFSYRFRYDDGEYSVFAPFTQITFIPKQDGYFMQKTPAATGIEEDDEEAAYKTTIVEFVENKVDKILLRIPLESTNSLLQSSLKVTEIDILYKEADQLAVKVVDTISIGTIANQSGTCSVSGNFSGVRDIVVGSIAGGIQVGSIVNGEGIVDGTTVAAFDQDTSTITMSVAQTLSNLTLLTIGEPNFFVYNYQSKKPYKTLPESEIVRVYDKVPVKAFGQEIISNRVVYSNFQDKHTPPATLDYNVNASPKADFSLKGGTVEVNGNFTNVGTINYTNVTGDVFTGSFVSSESAGVTIPAGTTVLAFTPASLAMTFSNNVTVANNDLLVFTANSDVEANVSKIEYPNHSLKENRNYQVGIVLSDKFGRQSSVILSDSLASSKVGEQEFIGSTIFSPYRTAGVVPAEWPGDSLKVLFNSPIYPLDSNAATGWPGIYNGNPASPKYNPLGWHSFKVVVKQTEQEYYNVYLPGVMAAYPENNTLELGRTSHTVLFNDNINKIPRDLTEVGPLQRLFRSSEELFGRVENLNATTGTQDKNAQYYPGRVSEVVSSIAGMNDLFGLNPLSVGYPVAGYKEFYLFESNPLIARISTTTKFGVPATVVQATVNGVISNNIDITVDAFSSTASLQPKPGDIVSGAGILADTSVVSFTENIGTVRVNQAQTLADDTLLLFSPQVAPINIQNLAVFETAPVESLLDIFWETSTSGLVSDLNTAILDQSLGGANLENFATTNFTEAATIGTVITDAPFYLTDSFSSQIPQANITEFSLTSVTDANDVDRLLDFELDLSLNNGTYRIKTKSLFWYGLDPDARVFTFEFKVITTDGTASTFIEEVKLINIVPEIICPKDNQTIVVDIDDTFVTQITGYNGSAYKSATGQTPAVANLAGQDLIWELVQKDSTGAILADGFGPFTGTPVVPAEGTDQIAALNITKNTTSAGIFFVEIILKDTQGQVGAGSLSTVTTACNFTVDIEAPCVDGQQVVVKSGPQVGNIIDATAVFNGLVSGSVADGNQLFNIEGIVLNNPTANIYSHCNQEANGNIQAGDIYKSGLLQSSQIQAYINGAWSDINGIQYYQTGSNATGQIKMRPVFTGASPIDFSTLPLKTQLRFSTGKKQIGYINQAGTRCDAIFNYSTLFVFYRAPGAAIQIFPDPVGIGGVCYIMPLTQCVSPICPVAVGGNAPYVFAGFQPDGPNGQGNSCGNSGVTQPYCNS